MAEVFARRNIEREGSEPGGSNIHAAALRTSQDHAVRLASSQRWREWLLGSEFPFFDLGLSRGIAAIVRIDQAGLWDDEMRFGFSSRKGVQTV